jgi:enoyl-CoA hydratase
MGSLVTYAGEEAVATITMDDGRVNVLSLAMLSELASALDRAEADGAVVVLAGREGVFSAGFDLAVINAGGPEVLDMLRSGFELAERLLSFPTPVVIASTGHAVAMGVFVLLSGDYRIGAAGPFRTRANEVAIGMTMPLAAIEICRQRLTPAAFNRAVILAEPFRRDDAVTAGFLDRVAPAGEVVDLARSTAAAFVTLDLNAHAATKRRARAGVLTALRAAIEADDAALRSRL